MNEYIVKIVYLLSQTSPHGPSQKGVKSELHGLFVTSVCDLFRYFQTCSLTTLAWEKTLSAQVSAFIEQISRATIYSGILITQTFDKSNQYKCLLEKIFPDNLNLGANIELILEFLFKNAQFCIHIKKKKKWNNL